MLPLMPVGSNGSTAILPKRDAVPGCTPGGQKALHSYG
jgi:hypothetical protein